MSWAHACSSEACPATEQCKQLRDMHGAWLMVHCGLPGNAETAWDCQYVRPYKKTSTSEGEVEEGKVQESPATAADWLAVGALGSGSGWPSAQQKHGVGMIRGRERR